VGEHASILTKVSIWVSLQNIEKCGKMWKRGKIQKDMKSSMSNIVRYNSIIRKVHRRAVTVHTVTKRSKEVRGYKTVQYICRTWVKLVLERVPCTVNKHRGECTAVYSTNRQSEYETSVERFPMPAKVEKVTCCRLVDSMCKNQIVMVVRYVRYGMMVKGNRRIDVNGRNIRMVMVARYVRYDTKIKRFTDNKAKVSGVCNYRNKTLKESIKVGYGMYSKSTEAPEKNTVKMYKDIAGTQVYKRCKIPGSINVYLEGRWELTYAESQVGAQKKEQF
jgi:hypothetical protein